MYTMWAPTAWTKRRRACLPQAWCYRGTGLYIPDEDDIPAAIAASAFVLKITLWLPNRGMTFSLMACRSR